MNVCLRYEGPSIGLDDHRHLCGATRASVGTPERTAHVGTKRPPPEAGCPAPPVYAKQYSTQEAGKGRQDVQQREPTERTCQHSSPRGCTRSVASTAGSPRACACLRTRFTVHMLLSLNSKPRSCRPKGWKRVDWSSPATRISRYACLRTE